MSDQLRGQSGIEGYVVGVLQRHDAPTETLL